MSVENISQKWSDSIKVTWRSRCPIMSQMVAQMCSSAHHAPHAPAMWPTMSQHGTMTREAELWLERQRFSWPHTRTEWTGIGRWGWFTFDYCCNDIIMVMLCGNTRTNVPVSCWILLSFLYGVKHAQTSFLLYPYHWCMLYPISYIILYYISYHISIYRGFPEWRVLQLDSSLLCSPAVCLNKDLRIWNWIPVQHVLRHLSI